MTSPDITTLFNPVIFVTISDGVVHLYSDTLDIDVYTIDYDAMEWGEADDPLRQESLAMFDEAFPNLHYLV